MKHLKYIIVIALTVVSCSKSKEQLLKTSSTISIDNDDTKDSIVFKAAHIVPTPNQYKALKNEFIAFILEYKKLKDKTNESYPRNCSNRAKGGKG